VVVIAIDEVDQSRCIRLGKSAACLTGGRGHWHDCCDPLLAAQDPDDTSRAVAAWGLHLRGEYRPG
jgi:hypothetical protein